MAEPLDDVRRLATSTLRQLALARERTLMANERTLLAYVRTSLAMIVAGATLINFFRLEWIRTIGFALIPAGLILLFWGLVRYRQNRNAILNPSSRPLEEDDEQAD